MHESTQPSNNASTALQLHLFYSYNRKVTLQDFSYPTLEFAKLPQYY